MKKIHPFFLVLLLAAAAGGGCYTVLSHPETLDQPAEGLESKACSDCHSDADLYHYTDSYNMGWYDSYPAPWAAYYATPWWYDNYWAYEPQPRRSERAARRERAPPLVQGLHGRIGIPSDPGKPGRSRTRHSGLADDAGEAGRRQQAGPA